MLIATLFILHTRLQSHYLGEQITLGMMGMLLIANLVSLAATLYYSRSRGKWAAPLAAQYVAQIIFGLMTTEVFISTT